MAHEIIKGLVHIPPKRGETEQQYRERIASYLYDLLYLRYEGHAHEIHHEGSYKAWAAGLDDEKLFKHYHREHGWNLEFEAPEERGLTLHSSSAFAPAGDWDPHEALIRPDSRTDFIHWSRDDGERGYHLDCVLIKYFDHLQLTKKFDTEYLFGVLFASQYNTKRKNDPDHISHRIKRTVHALDTLLQEKHVPHQLTLQEIKNENA